MCVNTLTAMQRAERFFKATGQDLLAEIKTLPPGQRKLLLNMFRVCSVQQIADIFEIKRPIR